MKTHKYYFIVFLLLFSWALYPKGKNISGLFLTVWYQLFRSCSVSAYIKVSLLATVEVTILWIKPCEKITKILQDHLTPINPHPSFILKKFRGLKMHVLCEAWQSYTKCVLADNSYFCISWWPWVQGGNHCFIFIIGFIGSPCIGPHLLLTSRETKQNVFILTDRKELNNCSWERRHIPPCFKGNTRSIGKV